MCSVCLNGLETKINLTKPCTLLEQKLPLGPWHRSTAFGFCTLCVNSPCRGCGGLVWGFQCQLSESQWCNLLRRGPLQGAAGAWWPWLCMHRAGKHYFRADWNPKEPQGEKGMLLTSWRVIEHSLHFHPWTITPYQVARLNSQINIAMSKHADTTHGAPEYPLISVFPGRGTINTSLMPFYHDLGSLVYSTPKLDHNQRSTSSLLVKAGNYFVSLFLW